MENNKLQRANTKVLSSETKSLCAELFRYNLLTQYPLSDAQIIDWANTIQELAPRLDNNTVRTVINRIIVGSLPYDSRLGIQNILKGYKETLLEKILELKKQPTLLAEMNEVRGVFDSVFGSKDFTLTLPKAYDN